MAPQPNRHGFTLIELLVVISTISTLVAMLLPAVQRVRESARQMQCRNNLRQMGLALHQYEGAHRVYPRMCQQGRGSTSGAQGFSVHAMLLPYLEQQALYQQINFNTYVEFNPNITTGNGNILPRFTRVSTFLCPSDFGGTPVRGAGNNYVVSGGPSLVMISPIPGRSIGGNSTSIGPGDEVGLFSMRRTIGQRHVRDGLSNCIAVSEAIIGDGNTARYTTGDLVRNRPFPANISNTFVSASVLNTYGEDCRANSSTHYSDPHKYWINGIPAQSAFNTLNPPNSENPDCHECTTCNWYDSRGVWSARSRHAAGVHVLMADGSCRMMADNVDLQAWQSLGAIDSGVVVSF